MTILLISYVLFSTFCCLFKGHNPEDSITQTNYGYCAAPDITCYNGVISDGYDISKLERGKSFNDSENFPYQRNTGVINARVNAVPRYKKRKSLKFIKGSERGILSESVVSQVFVHEIGHSFGAKHDDSDDTCNPSGIDNYLMTGQAKVNVHLILCIVILLIYVIFDTNNYYNTYK